MSKNPETIGKNIVILCDGTGQKGGKDPDKNSNVYKLFLALKERSGDQVVYYDSGVGSSRFMNKIIGGATGKGFYKNFRQAYRFLYQNFEAGDKIFLLGFSRGAATIRSLASFIYHFGILPKHHEDLVERAFKIYRMRNRTKRAEKARAFIDNNKTVWTDVHFMGAWDTVFSVGLHIEALSSIIDIFPRYQHKFHELDMKEGVIHAHQALAIDDTRKLFLPKIWSKQEIEANKKLKNWSQVWFAGAHSDVGGSYEESGLSDIALEWMVSKAVAEGLKLYRSLGTKPDPLGELHNPQHGIKAIHPDEQRAWPEDMGPPTVHQSVITRYKDPSMKYDSWILQGAYKVEEAKAKK